MRLLAYVAGSLNQELLLRNEYLAAENRSLGTKLPSRLRLSNPERITLAERSLGPGGGGPSHILTTAGKLLFTHNQNYVIAFDRADGKILWLASLAARLTAGPITYMQDGTQYVLVAAGHSLYAFAVNRRADARRVGLTAQYNHLYHIPSVECY